MNLEILFGKHAIFEALTMNFPVQKILITENAKEKNAIAAQLRKLLPKVKIEYVPKRTIDNLAKGARSGGVCAILHEPAYLSSVSDLIRKSKIPGKPCFLIAVDEMHDPRNLGAIIRSAVGAGFAGVIFQKDRQVGITGVVASSSAGTCFRIPLLRVVNLPRALDELKNNDFWVFGTDSETNNSLYETKFSECCVVVIGSEGKGLRRLVKEKCDHMISIPMNSSLESLNASVAAGIIMFEVRRQFPV